MKLRQFIALPRHERALLVTAWALGVLCRLALVVCPYERVRALLMPAAALVPTRESPVQRIVWAVQTGLARVPGAACLARALVLEALLRAAGRKPEVCLGVAFAGGFRAHAWVELDGVPVLGAPQPGEYVRLMPVGVDPV